MGNPIRYWCYRIEAQGLVLTGAHLDMEQAFVRLGQNINPLANLGVLEDPLLGVKSLHVGFVFADNWNEAIDTFANNRLNYVPRLRFLVYGEEQELAIAA